MEDSIIAAYIALLIGIIIQNNSVSVLTHLDSFSMLL